MNLSNTTFSLDLNAIITGTFEYEHINATNPLQKDITTQNLIINKGTSSSNTQSVAYSLFYARSQIVTAINEINCTSDFAVYPNPAKNLVVIKNNQQTNELMRIQIIDTQGRLILSKQSSLHNGQTTIDLADIPKQVLFIKLTNQKGKQQTVKILKE